MNEADNYQDAVNGRRVADVVAQHTATMSDSLSKPMFLSDQFEAYLKVVEMELDGRIQRLVDLRSLHEKLGVRDNYRDWAPRSLTNSRSVEGVHYISRVDPRNVGRPSKEKLFSCKSCVFWRQDTNIKVSSRRRSLNESV